MKNISGIGNKCYGCGSCEQKCPVNCITVEENHEGFIYPIVNSEKCIECKICINSCPVINVDKIKNKNTIKQYAVINNDRKRLLNSASGGMSDVVAYYIIDNGGVVYGAAYDAKLKVKHIRVDNKKDLYRIQSSKYVQSDTRNIYNFVKKDLRDDKVVLFTGTPCQIAGLYAFLGDKNNDNLYTLDIICHGVPSPKFFEKYINYIEHKLNEKVIFYNFRDKSKKGWGTQYLLKTKTKTKTKTLALDKYGSHFMKGDCYRESCYKCQFANIKRPGDITTGDFWGVYSVYPDFASRDGVSSVIINNRKGEKLFESIRKKIHCIEIRDRKSVV